MPVNHDTSVSGGDTVSSIGWNNDHDVTGAFSMITFTFTSNPNGVEHTVSSTNYEDVSNTTLVLPGTSMQSDGYNKAKLILLAKGDKAGGTKQVRIYNDTDSAEVVASGTWSGTSNESELSAIASYSFPTGVSKEYIIQVKSSDSTETITLYQVILIAYVA